jgi:hypothetical protein
MFYSQKVTADDKFCPPCQAAYDSNPLGALVRRWSAACADVDGRQAGLVCDRCKSIVRARHTRTAYGGQLFHFANPNRDPEKPEPGAPARSAEKASAFAEKASAFARMSEEEQAARRHSHEQELLERLSWCLEHALTPAHEHVHSAPGNDVNFMVRDFTCLSRYSDSVPRLGTVS